MSALTLAEQIRGETYDGQFQIVEFTLEERTEMVQQHIIEVINKHEKRMAAIKAEIAIQESAKALMASTASVVESITDSAATAVNTISNAVSWMSSAFSSSN